MSEPGSGEHMSHEQFVEIRNSRTLLRPEDFDADDNLIIEDSCAGCPIPEALADIYTSNNEDFYDLNEQIAIAPMMAESVYRDCPGRSMNRMSKFEKTWRRILGQETLRMYVLREETAGKAPGTFHPCGLDIVRGDHVT